VKGLIITNNPIVSEKFGNEYRVEYVDQSFEDLLARVRDFVHKGYVILTHPLSGSIKPKETPYKSVLLSEVPLLTGVEGESLKLIENSIIKAKAFEDKTNNLSESVLNDFRLIDLSLLESAL
jgi:hypothetical protein